VALGLKVLNLVFSELVLCSYLDLLILGFFDHEVFAGKARQRLKISKKENIFSLGWLFWLSSAS
jgi:hypothetical protein